MGFFINDCKRKVSIVTRSPNEPKLSSQPRTTNANACEVFVRNLFHVLCFNSGAHLVP